MIRHFKFSLFASIFILTFIFVTVYKQENWNKDNSIIIGDTKGYYAYLPALFIYQNLKFEQIDNPEFQKVKNEMWFQQDDQGRNYIKFSCGSSILFSPFFLIAHQYAKHSVYEANGFSTPYKVALQVSSFTFLIIGLFYIIKWLNLFFKDHIVAIILILLLLGTNLFYYYTTCPAYVHGYSFALISVFLYYSSVFIEKPSIKVSIIVGFCFGLLVLVRPLDAIYGLFPLLYSVSTLNEFKKRVVFFWEKRIMISIALGAMFLAFSPQIAYNIYIFDSLFKYPYEGEGFFLYQPKYLKALFSYRNGWLVYSPIIVFALIGILLLSRRWIKVRLWLIITTTIYTYFVVSWWCWWYIGFGNRGFISLYPAMALGLGCFLHWLFLKKWYIQISTLLILTLLIGLNQFQTYQFNHWTIDYESMTKDAYWDSFGRWTPSANYLSLLRAPEYDLALNGIDAYYEPINSTILYKSVSFDSQHTDTLFIASPQSYIDSNRKVLVVNQNEYDCNYEIIVPPSPDNALLRLKISAQLTNTDKINLVVSTINAEELYLANGECVDKGDYCSLEVNSLLKENMSGKKLKIYLWNPKKIQYEFKSFCIEILDEKYEVIRN